MARDYHIIKKRYVYILRDPRVGFLNVYIGQSTNPNMRLIQHLSKAKEDADRIKRGYTKGINVKKTIWLQELKSLHLKPILNIVHEAHEEFGDMCVVYEMPLIEEFRERDYIIMNS